MEFSETLSYLLSLGHETLAMKLGLKNTELLLEALGNPHHSFASVQIAGTNGKGSTAAAATAPAVRAKQFACCAAARTAEPAVAAGAT